MRCNFIKHKFAKSHKYNDFEIIIIMIRKSKKTEMKNKKLKKTLITVGCVIVAIALVFGILFLIKNITKKPVNVYDMSNFVMTGYWGDSSETSGTVSVDDLQKVYVSSTQTVKEVYVKEGQTVKKGDKLMSYDTTLTELEVSRAEVELEKKKIELQEAQENITKLSNQKSSEELEAELVKLQEKLDAAVEKTPGATSEMPKLPTGSWTEESPRYIEAPENTNINDLFKQAGKNDIYVVFVTVHDDTYVNYQGLHFTKTTGNNTDKSKTSSESYYVEAFEADHLSASTPVETDEIKQIKSEIESVEEELAGASTKADIASSRAEQEEKVQNLNIEIKIADVNLREKKTELSDGVVYSKIDGTVKTVKTASEAQQDGTALIEVSAGGGYYIIGTLNELELDTVKVGQTVQLSSWDSGTYCEGEITEISHYPSTDYSGDDSRNLSYYPFKVSVSPDENLKENEYVSITYSSEAENTDTWYLEKMFIRQEDGKSYVYIQGEDGKLEKRYITTGKDLWGTHLEIKDGLTSEGFIAFPYGSNVTEGAKTKEADTSELYNY